MRSTWCVVVAIAAITAAATERSAHASSCVPGFDYGAFGRTSVEFGGNSGLDSYDSSLGTYATTQSNVGGNLGTNGSAAGALTIHGTAASVYGDLFYGPAGNASSVTIHGHPTTGASSALAAPLALPPVAIPAVGAALGARSGGALAPNNTYTTVSGAVTLSGGTYVIGTLTAAITVAASSTPVLVYVTGSFDPGSITNSTGHPGSLVFMIGPSIADVSLTGLGGVYALYAPSTDVAFHGNADLFGAIVANTIEMTGTGAIHYDKALQSFAAGPFTCAAAEVSRAAPVIATIANQTSLVQGTFEAPTGTQARITDVASVAGFRFPYLAGHMRARVASTITTTSSAFSSGTIVFDAAASGKIPTVVNAGCTAKNGTCRNVFTITSSPDPAGTQFHPTMVQLKDSNAGAIGALIAPASVVTGIGPAQWQTIVRTVLAGSLGGVDRSSVAVIPASTLAGVATRPTIAYFGAADGMLHAVCASTGGTTASTSNICPSLGTELWAFLPRVQLPLIRTNTARVDGSPRVVDMFGDLTNNPATGAKSWHTVLTFQTGFSVGGKPAAYALDVTDPASPVVLWEYTTPAAPTALDLGTGLVVAAGSVRTSSGGLKNIAVLETSNGGTGGTGVVTTAVSQETGEKLWQFGYAYPTPPRGVAADLPLATTGIPGGAAAVDLAGKGLVTDIVFGDLYGNLWRLDATTGTSRNGATTPVFSFSTNKHPIGAVPAIYSDGSQQFAAFASGGYVDPTATSWTTTTQYLIAIKLSSTAATISETTAACASCALAIKQTLTTGDKGFSQALVVGTQLFLTTDSADVNQSGYGTSANTGHVMTFDLTGGSPTTVVVNSGGASLASAGTTLYSSSSNGQQRLATAATTTAGTSVVVTAVARIVRQLWLRSK